MNNCGKRMKDLFKEYKNPERGVLSEEILKQELLKIHPSNSLRPSASLYPLVICYIAIENGPVEIVDFPMNNCHFQ